MPGRSVTREEMEGMLEPTVLQWPQFQEYFLSRHQAGEHIAIVAPTGSGKTLLGVELCKLLGTRMGKDRRPARVVILNFKPRDDTISALDWPVVTKWPPSFGEEHCIVWPKGGAASGRARRQRMVFGPLLDQIDLEGGQTVYIPEAAYFERPLPKGLSLGGTMEQFWSTARSNKLTVISDTQRPREVTRLMWSEPTWKFIFRVEDADDLKRVAEMSGQKVAVWHNVPRLGGFEFLCVYSPRGSTTELTVSRVAVTRDKRNRKERT